MSFRIQNNISSLVAQRNLSISDSSLSKSLERLSSGYRINSAKDDAAGLGISQGFRADIAGAKVAQRNISEANAFLQTAEGGMEQIGDILTRMKELATQSASANVGTTDRAKIAAEYSSLVSEIDRIANSTKYSGTELLKGYSGSPTSDKNWNALVENVYDTNWGAASTGLYTVTNTGAALTITHNAVSETKTVTAGATISFDTFGISFKTTSGATAASVATAIAAQDPTLSAGSGGAFQIGYKNVAGNDRLSVNLDDVDTTALGVAAADVSSQSAAQTAIATVDTAVSRLTDARADVGAFQNRLTYASSNLSVTLENFTAAESVIRDTDMAAEMTSFTKNQILMQAGTAMLAQANMAPQQILSLFK